VKRFLKLYVNFGLFQHEANIHLNFARLFALLAAGDFRSDGLNRFSGTALLTEGQLGTLGEETPPEGAWIKHWLISLFSTGMGG